VDVAFAGLYEAFAQVANASVAGKPLSIYRAVAMLLEFS
jgi:hypothetical protein